MENLPLIPDELRQRIEGEVKTLLSGAVIDKITTQEQMGNANSLVVKIMDLADELKTEREELYRPHKDNCDRISTYFKEQEAPLLTLKKNLNTVMAEYTALLERQRAEAQRIADETARKEREKIEAQARAQQEREETARREAARLAEKAAAEQDLAKRLKLEQEAAEGQAVADKAAEKAAVKMETAQTLVAPVIAAPPKPTGFVSKKSYTVDVYNMELFIGYVVRERKFHLVEPATETLNKIASAEQGAFNLPGCRLIIEDKGQTRRART